MMLNEEQLALIQQYVDGELSAEGQTKFDTHMANDAEFAAEVALEREIIAFFRHPATKARLMADEALRNKVTTPLSIVITYTLNELLQMFAPAPDLEEAIVLRSAAANVAPSLQGMVVLPKQGIDCDDLLFFVLSEAITSPLHCFVFDNQQTQLIKQVIPANEGAFEVALALPPGRYYWELIPTDRHIRQRLGDAKGMFFVNEALMPQG